MKDAKCPYCGSKKFVEAEQSAYGAVYPANKILTFKSQTLYHLICLKCGAVVKSYVKQPEKLLKKGKEDE